MDTKVWSALYDSNIHTDKYVNKWVDEAVELVRDGQIKTEEDIEKALSEVEPDIQTYDLRNWIGESCDALAYLDRAIQEFAARDAIELLSVAQWLAKTDVYRVVLRTLED